MWRHGRVDGWLAGAVFAGALTIIIIGIRVEDGKPVPPFFIDEAHKLGETYYWHLAFERADLINPDWSDDFYARTNPPMGKYVFGAALALGGFHVRDRQLEDDFDRFWRQPSVLRAEVPDGMLRITRWTSALFCALTCAVLCLAGSHARGPLVGLGAAILFLTHPTVLHQARLGLTDTILLFFLALAMPVTLTAIRMLDIASADERLPTNLRKTAAAIVLPGVVVGLAAGTKLIGALAGFVVALGLAWSAWTGSRGPLPRRLGIAVFRAVLVGLIALASLVALDPYYYAHPLPRLLDRVHVLHDWTVKQQVDPGGGLLHVGERIAAVGQFSLKSATLPLAILFGTAGVWITILAFVSGCAHLLAAAFAHRQAAAAVVIAWVIVGIAGIASWLPLVWTRYLLLPYAAVCLSVAVGLCHLPGDLVAMMRRKRIAATVAVLAVGAILALTSWVVDPALVSPFAPIVNDSRRQQEWHRRALRDSTGGSIALAHNKAALLMRDGHPAAAEPLLQDVLARLAQGGDGSSASLVRQCEALGEMARVKRAGGDPLGADEALRARISVLSALQRGMTSTDPKISASYDELIAADRSALATP